MKADELSGHQKKRLPALAVKRTAFFKKGLFSVSIALTLAFLPSRADAEIVKSAHTEAQLISETLSVQPGASVYIALHLKMDKGWHTYWKNPGDSGLSTTIDWQLEPGYFAGPLEWPYPEKIDLPPLSIYGYEDEVLLFTKITVPEDVSLGEEAVIKANVRWLACEINCIPGQANLTLELPVSSDSPEINSRWSKDFSRFRSKLPLTHSSWEIKAFADPNFLLIEMNPKEGLDLIQREVLFYPYDPELIAHAEPQKLRVEESRSLLKVKRSRIKTETLNQIEGILVSGEGWRVKGAERALEIDLDVQPLSRISERFKENPREETSLFSALLFAFLGGIILNLMPCVFPVLSLKVLGFVEQAQRTHRPAWHHGAAFAAGVLFSFWVLAGLLIALRAAGQSIGWGYQLQSPYFVSGLIFLFFILGLNLLGIFEAGISFASFGSKADARKDGLQGTFMSGMLASVIATPCTAPFMGTAVGYALVQTPLTALAVFSSLGLGMAFPYMLFSLLPGWVNRLPKPGRWMIRLKQGLSIFLFATVFWLAWVFFLQTSFEAVGGLFVGLCLTGASAWIYGRKLQTGSNHQAMKIICLSLFIAGAVMIISSAAWRENRFEHHPESEGSDPDAWIVYSAEKLAALQREGRPVFLDFTAAWCLTCHVNERIALDAPSVRQKFREKNVVLMKADWTHRDESVTQALASHGRTSIPFYLLYSGNRTESPVELPEILTPNIVLQALDNLRNPEDPYLKQ